MSDDKIVYRVYVDSDGSFSVVGDTEETLQKIKTNRNDPFDEDIDYMVNGIYLTEAKGYFTYHQKNMDVYYDTSCAEDYSIIKTIMNLDDSYEGTAFYLDIDDPEWFISEFRKLADLVEKSKLL